MGNLIELVEQNKLSLELVKHVLLLLFEGDTRTPSEVKIQAKFGILLK